MKIRFAMQAAACLLSGCAAGQSLADASIKPGEDPAGRGILYITHTISKADADYVAQQNEGAYKNKSLMVMLDSEGGNVAAAMAIGKIVRRNEWAVTVGNGWKCYSSCALIYVAGVSRYNLGYIGLHRPYFAESLDRQQIELSAPIMLQKVREYLQSMGIVDSFYEQMVNTEPSKVRIYFGDEIEKLVPTDDPTSDEIENAYDARNYGVSAGEMRQRKTEAEQKCGRLFSFETLLDFNYCQQSIFWGIDEGTYREREKNGFAECLLSPDEQKIFNATDIKKRRDLPSYVRMRACIRDKVLGGLPNAPWAVKKPSNNTSVIRPAATSPSG